MAQIDSTSSDALPGGAPTADHMTSEQARHGATAQSRHGATAQSSGPQGPEGDLRAPEFGSPAPGAAAVEVKWPTASSRWAGALVVAAALLVVVALGAWQFVSLHNQVHHLQKTTQTQAHQIVTQQNELSELQSSVSAAVSCLETPQAQPGLCTRFLK